jgi:hypothetical protein
MEIIKHPNSAYNVGEIVTDNLILQTIEDGTELAGNLYYQGLDVVIIHQKNITPDFFELSNKMAGEILQKFSNFRMRLILIGDFENVSSKSLRDFIYESNKGRQVNFSPDLTDVLKRIL